MTPERKKQLKAEFATNEQRKIREAIPMDVSKLKELLTYLNREDASPCDHSLSDTIQWLGENGEDPEPVVSWLRDNGGYCDCEVISNVYDTGFVAVGVVDVVGGFVFEEAFVFSEDAVGLATAVLAHALVERGEEEVLEDGLIISGAGFALGIEAFEDLVEIIGLEEFFRDEILFFDEPAKDEAGEQANEPGRSALLVVGLSVGGEIDLRECPEIPVGEFLVEAVVEEFDVEDFFPGCVQGIEAVNRLLFGMGEIFEGEGIENIFVTAMGIGERDVADDGGFFEDIFFRPHFVAAAVDDGDGEDGFPIGEVLDEHHDGHWEDAVDLAGDGGELAAGVVAAS
jgi:hypothetical protein